MNGAVMFQICGRCKSRFELFVNKNGKTVPVESTPARNKDNVTSTPRPAFADFVKKHYREIRGSATTHKAAMTQLGSMFRDLKFNDDDDKEN